MSVVTTDSCAPAGGVKSATRIILRDAEEGKVGGLGEGERVNEWMGLGLQIHAHFP